MQEIICKLGNLSNTSFGLTSEFYDLIAKKTKKGFTGGESRKIKEKWSRYDFVVAI